MKLCTSIIAGCVFTLTTACAQNNEPAANADALGPGQVATVNGTRIAESVFRLYTLRALQRSPDDLSDEERADVIDQLVTVQLIADEAVKRGLGKERVIAAELEFVRLQTLARAMAERYQQENPPTETELRAIYDENLPRLARTEYKARHILVDTEELATDLIEQIDGGADFAALARENSTDTASGQNGGDLGWFSADSMVAPFAEAVSTMAVGTHSATPVETQFGWHVIMVEDSRDQQPPGLEAVRDELTQAAGRQKLDQFVQALKEGAVIEVGE